MTRTTKKTKGIKTLSKGRKSLSHIQRFKKTPTKKPLKHAKSVSYQEYLIESLKDPEEATGYLNAALVGGDIKVFLLALQNVIQAHGGIAVLSEKTHKSRTSLYKTISANGNPYLKSANELLYAMGMHLAVVVNK